MQDRSADALQAIEDKIVFILRNKPTMLFEGKTMVELGAPIDLQYGNYFNLLTSVAEKHNLEDVLAEVVDHAADEAPPEKIYGSDYRARYFHADGSRHKYANYFTYNQGICYCKTCNKKFHTFAAMKYHWMDEHMNKSDNEQASLVGEEVCETKEVRQKDVKFEKADNRKVLDEAEVHSNQELESKVTEDLQELENLPMKRCFEEHVVTLEDSAQIDECPEFRGVDAELQEQCYKAAFGAFPIVAPALGFEDNQENQHQEWHMKKEEVQQEDVLPTRPSLSKTFKIVKATNPDVKTCVPIEGLIQQKREPRTALHLLKRFGCDISKLKYSLKLSGQTEQVVKLPGNEQAKKCVTVRDVIFPNSMPYWSRIRQSDNVQLTKPIIKREGVSLENEPTVKRFSVSNSVLTENAETHRDDDQQRKQKLD